MHRHLHLSLLAALLFCACSGPEEPRRTILQAEALCDSLPDSALTLLESVDPRSLHSRADKALYALILGRALDRCDSIIASDSIIAPAVDYFTPERDPLRHSMTAYYLGRTYFNADDYRQSLLAFLDGLETAESDSLFFWAAMNARGIMQNFNMTANGSQELKYAELSYDYFKKTDRQLHTAYALLDKGKAMFNCGSNLPSLDIFKSVAEQGLQLNDSVLWAEATGYSVCNLQLLNRNNEAISTALPLIASGRAEAADSMYLAFSYIQIGQPQLAKRIASGISASEPELVDLYHFVFNNAEGRYPQAIDALLKVNNNNRRLFFERYNQDLSFNIVSYYHEQKELKEQALKTSRQLSLVLTIASVLFFALIILLIIHLRRIKQQQKYQYSVLAEELKQSHDLFNTAQAHTANTIYELVHNQYSLLDKLSQGFYENLESSSNSKRIYKTISQLIKSFTDSPKGFKEAEAVARKYYGDLISQDSDFISSITPAEYKLLILSSLGFSSTAIALFMGDNNVSYVYNRKRHLKEKILKLDTESASRYLKILN